jgi:hypothetical protein
MIFEQSKHLILLSPTTQRNWYREEFKIYLNWGLSHSDVWNSAVLSNLIKPHLLTARGKNKQMSVLFVLFKNDRKSKIYEIEVSAAMPQAYWLVRLMCLHFGSWQNHLLSFLIFKHPLGHTDQSSRKLSLILGTYTMQPHSVWIKFMQIWNMVWYKQ